MLQGSAREEPSSKRDSLENPKPSTPSSLFLRALDPTKPQNSQQAPVKEDSRALVELGVATLHLLNLKPKNLRRRHVS